MSCNILRQPSRRADALADPRTRRRVPQEAPTRRRSIGRWQRCFCATPNVLVMTGITYTSISASDCGIAPHLLTAAPRLRCLTLAAELGVSKTYAMTGWRIGWIVGRREILTPFLTLLFCNSAGNPCSVSQAAAAEALAGDPHIRGPERRNLPPSGAMRWRSASTRSAVCPAACQKAPSTYSLIAADLYRRNSVARGYPAHHGRRCCHVPPRRRRRCRRGLCRLMTFALFPPLALLLGSHCGTAQNGAGAPGDRARMSKQPLLTYLQSPVETGRSRLIACVLGIATWLRLCA